jgi:hypothetical protein
MHQTPEGAPVFTPGTNLAEEFKEVKAQVRHEYYGRTSREANSWLGRRNNNLEAIPRIL